MQNYENAPEKYKEEIANTNFTILEQDANNFLETTIIPYDINPGLQATSLFVIPGNLGQFLKEPTVELHQDFLTISSNVITELQRARKPLDKKPKQRIPFVSIV